MYVMEDMWQEADWLLALQAEFHKTAVSQFENWEVKENCFKNLINREEKEIFFLQILKIKKRKRFVFQNLINREEKEKFFLKILKIEKRKGFVFQNLINREEKENFFLKILKIEKRKGID